MRKIKAPFKEEEVKFLNDWQKNPYIHPYTCINNSDHYHLDSGGVLNKMELTFKSF